MNPQLSKLAERKLAHHLSHMRQAEVKQLSDLLGSKVRRSSPAEEVEHIARLREERGSRIYIAGPMTGLPDLNFPAFNAAAVKLRSGGWHVENPAEHGVVPSAEWGDYLRWDLARMMTCGTIYLLPGWEKSKGARLEHQVATALGMPVLWADGAAQASAPTPQPDPLQPLVALQEQAGMYEDDFASKADSVLGDAARIPAKAATKPSINKEKHD